MDTLTKMNAFILALAAVLLTMACVKADRVGAWRTRHQFVGPGSR